MNLRNVESYQVGLDIGTGSVGWAVLDDNGDLCRFKGKPTWGSRVFPAAETAAEARVHRGQRRRYDRRRQRIDLLQGFFADEVAKVDPEFFIRLNQARLHPEDRDPAHADYRCRCSMEATSPRRTTIGSSPPSTTCARTC